MQYSIVIENIKVPIVHDEEMIFHEAKKILRRVGLSNHASSFTVRKKSIDARKKNNIVLVCSVAAELNGIKNIDKLSGIPGVKVYAEKEENISFGSVPMDAPPVIAGFGPAGMFCALELAKNGYGPIVYERGGSIEERIAAVDEFMRGGEFSPQTNIQFGAGGAGTFSDGKLTTRIGDPMCRSILETFCEFGAPAEIMWQAKPHIGTDVLRNIVENIDKKINSLGGRVLYNSRVSDICHNSISVNGESARFGVLVLAIGHSARDTYAELMNKGYSVIPKPFSVGVRIEHLQEDINFALYGDAAEYLPPAEYSLSLRKGERGVYSFCMCPGGVVVPAASEECGVVTNGMSYSSRSGINSNAAIAVSVLPNDFNNDPAGAIAFQRNLEKLAFVHGGGNYYAPCQTVGNFLRGGNNDLGRIIPTYMDGRVQMCDLSAILPNFVTDMLMMGISGFNRNIKGFDCDDAILTGVETRTSAPVRIPRGDDRRITDLGCEIYPCGEGAGYAGGIMSAAVDGIKTARAIMAKFAPCK